MIQGEIVLVVVVKIVFFAQKYIKIIFFIFKKLFLTSKQFENIKKIYLNI